MRPGSALRNLLGSAAAFAALAASPVAATTIVPLSDPALVASAPLVLTGRVEGTLPCLMGLPSGRGEDVSAQG